jgi:hypothetical protein
VRAFFKRSVPSRGRGWTSRPPQCTHASPSAACIMFRFVLVVACISLYSSQQSCYPNTVWNSNCFVQLKWNGERWPMGKRLDSY